MSKYKQTGSTFTVSSDQDAVLLDKLPAAIYTIKTNLSGDLILEYLSDKFTLPERMYGNVLGRSDRVLNTYQDRTSSTGVLLSGTQGSGKTMLSKKICNDMIDNGIPVILVTSAYSGDNFISFINLIEQDAVVMFEEFEKMYDRYEQETLLTLFEGVFENKKLFILTVNYDTDLIKTLVNRPGRIYYKFKYAGLDDSTIIEYCSDKLNEKEHTKPIMNVSKMYDADFNFDMLKSIVEELNRYPDDTLSDVLNVLNLTTDDKRSHYLSMLVLDDDEKDVSSTTNITYREVLNRNNIDLTYYDDDEKSYEEFTFKQMHIENYDKDSGTVFFDDGKGNRACFKPSVYHKPLTILDHV